MDELSRRRIFLGILLIVIGVAFFATQFIRGAIGDNLILFAIGGAFLAAYFMRRNYGLLIPGCVLVGIAFGAVGEETVFGLGDFSAIGLGLGFIAIYVIDLVYRGKTHWWPLIPGGILVVVGIGASPQLERLFSVGWPLFLILIGLLLLAGAVGLFRRR